MMPFHYYALNEQRRYHADKGRFELYWSTNPSVPIRVKDASISQLEDELNNDFIQLCDSIKALHVVLQLISRTLTCVFHHGILLTIGDHPIPCIHIRLSTAFTG